MWVFGARRGAPTARAGVAKTSPAQRQWGKNFIYEILLSHVVGYCIKIVDNVVSQSAIP